MDKPLKISKNEISEENIALAYFYKQNLPPLILESRYGNKKIYKYSNNFQYSIINKAENKTWDKVLQTNITKKDINTIMSDI